MHWYPFNVGDYSAHTSRLSEMEDLAYRRLLDLYYINEQPFNGCSTDVARDIGMRQWQDEVDYVLNKYFPVDGDCFRNKRADNEVAIFQKRSKQAIAAGKASGKARQAKAIERTFNERSTVAEQNNKQQTTNSKKTIGQTTSDRFQDFWSKYPKKVKKKEALKVWKSMKLDTKADILITDIENRLNKDRRWKEGYITDPPVYLRGERWEDSIDTSESKDKKQNFADARVNTVQPPTEKERKIERAKELKKLGYADEDAFTKDQHHIAMRRLEEMSRTST
jgi:uncharacterized protein YdaU (DUF1376 family)